jgi:hypothetical protein
LDNNSNCNSVIYLLGELNSQWPITESAQTQTSMTAEDKANKTTKTKKN